MVARKYETVEGSLRYFRIPPAETVPDLEPVSPRAWKVDDLTCTGGFLLLLLFLSHYPSSISSLPVYIGGRLSSSSPLSGTIRSTITSQPRARPDRTELGREGEEREGRNIIRYDSQRMGRYGLDGHYRVLAYCQCGLRPRLERVGERMEAG